ncbi:GGDEF domain-containing protein [Mailhella massiliensis]|uniref:diguanylate cyclase n=1 Tax=Mailhella massiliensis TaxID=1903261 RepID=A0A921AUC3_9BACT|nr:GGDEF domain-containing protein [Mailhella massiliensis]HJD96070.1 diguanylate cyclase [Mailhella massiliensis]
MERAFTEEKRKNKIKELTSFFLHRHYCDNHAEAFVEYMDEVFLWFGAAEHEYIVGTENVAATLHTFKGKVPPCEISNEHYDVISVSENVYVCTGMLWISTSPSSDMYLRVHQRVTTVFRWTEQGPRCCHIHLSNPYTEMVESDIGFPEKMSLESRKYFQEQIEAQKKKIEEQNASIIQMHFEDLSTGLYNRNKFNQVCDALREDCGERLGVAYFDLNGLKKTNDTLGHHAGDELIYRTAQHLRRVFDQKAYRIGGDEFIVIDHESQEKAFHGKVQEVMEAMQKDHLSVSTGVSWRASSCGIDEQINEADRNMYLAKKNFYSQWENNRRSR